MTILEILSAEFNINPKIAENIVTLIDEGNTIPFIARYRKEHTNSMDDQVLRELSDRLTYLRNLEKRREEIISSITEQGKITDEIIASVENAKILSELEDIYRPYKQKRRTRATIAKEKGLEPLALAILNGADRTGLELAADYLGELVESSEEALAGALDIIAEIISDDASVRKSLRSLMQSSAILSTKASGEEDSVYSMYYEYSEPVSKIQNHRILAINRGEKEGFLKVKVEVNPVTAMAVLKRAYVPLMTQTEEDVKLACEDSYTRLIYPSIEREIRSELTDRASTSAIGVFASNLKQLLMQPKIRDKVCLALDPAYRTGCKIAVCDIKGDVLDTTVVYPTPPQSKTVEAKRVLTNLINKYNVEIIAIGNGTASKESEIFIAELLGEIKKPNLGYLMVSEAGASVYSASKLAAEEFPQFDVSLRSAVSISRRTQDPLSELVKIDPKAIGVGQYQHDMPANQLSSSLTAVVEDCVNSVGVDINTASPSLLSYISGLNGTTAKNIVKFRSENGKFTKRRQLLKVAKLGPKAYEQCAGFLRIIDGDILDNTSVHPESYDAAEKLLTTLGYTLEDVKNNNLSSLNANPSNISEISKEIGVGVPTLLDIIKELKKPGRDIRDDMPAPMLRSDVMDMKDLKAGMEIVGTVRNVIDFGAFIDIAVHQDGLVHISQISDKFIKHPSEALKVGDIVTVWVLSVDVPKKRIALTMKKPK